MSCPQLRIRLPRDHWIWTLSDTAERRKRVLEALDFYVRWHDRIERIVAAVEEIRQGSSPESPGGKIGDFGGDDWRFAASFEKLMDGLP